MEINFKTKGASTSERGNSFWAATDANMKFNVEAEWLKSVRSTDSKLKPNYGMGNMDSSHEEVVGNKLELVGPMLDSYLKEIGKSVKNKLCRSNCTGLVSPIALFMPWVIFKHLMVLATGYGGDFNQTKDGKSYSVTFIDFDSLFKVFSPARFDGENFMKYRVFRKEPDQETGKPTSTYKGRAAVVVSKNTPLIFRYSLKDSKVQVSFYVQRYTENDFAVDASLQTLVNMD